MQLGAYISEQFTNVHPLWMLLYPLVLFASLVFLPFSYVSFNGILSDIADVTNFVHPGTPLDDEASQRGTSVYLVERRIDMLPKPLTEGNVI